MKLSVLMISLLAAPSMAAHSMMAANATWKIPIRTLGGQAVTYEADPDEKTLNDLYKFVGAHHDAAQKTDAESTPFVIAFKDRFTKTETRLDRSDQTLRAAQTALKVNIARTRWMAIPAETQEVKQSAARSYTLNLDPHVVERRAITCSLTVDGAQGVTSTVDDLFQNILRQLEIRMDSKFKKNHWPHLRLVASESINCTRILIANNDKDGNGQCSIVRNGKKLKISDAGALTEFKNLMDSERANRAEYHLLGLPDKRAGARASNRGRIQTLHNHSGGAHDSFAHNLLGHNFAGGLKATKVTMNMPVNQHLVERMNETEFRGGAYEQLSRMFEKLETTSKKAHNELNQYVRILDKDVQPPDGGEKFHIVEMYLEGHVPAKSWKKIKDSIHYREGVNADASDTDSDSDSSEEDEDKKDGERDFIDKCNAMLQKQNAADPAYQRREAAKAERKRQLQFARKGTTDRRRREILEEAGVPYYALDDYSRAVRAQPTSRHQVTQQWQSTAAGAGAGAGNDDLYALSDDSESDDEEENREGEESKSSARALEEVREVQLLQVAPKRPGVALEEVREVLLQQVSQERAIEELHHLSQNGTPKRSCSPLDRLVNSETAATASCEGVMEATRLSPDANAMAEGETGATEPTRSASPPPAPQHATGDVAAMQAALQCRRAAEAEQRREAQERNRGRVNGIGQRASHNRSAPRPTTRAFTGGGAATGGSSTTATQLTAAQRREQRLAAMAKRGY